MKNQVAQTLALACSGAGLPDAAALVGGHVAKCRESSASLTQKCESNPPDPRTGGTHAKSRRGLAPRQRVAVEMLVAGRSVIAVARGLGVNPRTIFRWKKMPQFEAAVAERIGQIGRSLAADAKSTSRGGKSRLPRVCGPLPHNLLDDSHADDDDAEARDKEPAPTPEERREMERLFALAGITPSWRRSSIAKPQPETKEMSRFVAKCHAPESILRNEPTAPPRPVNPDRPGPLRSVGTTAAHAWASCDRRAASRPDLPSSTDHR